MKKFIVVLLLIFIFSAALAQHSASLIAHYPFDGNARDVSHNQLDGKWNGPLETYDRFGNTGRAFAFDGVDDYIELPVNINPKGMPVVTITMWVKARSWQGRPKVFSHDDGGFDRTIGIDDRDGGVGWSVFSGSGNVLGHHPVILNQWYFLAVVYDQTYEERGQVTGRVKMYVDDDSVYQEAGITGNGLDYVYVGANPTSGHYFKGSIDDIRIYEGELTSVQINQLYSGANPNIQQPPDVAWTKRFSGVYDNYGMKISLVSEDDGIIIAAVSTEKGGSPFSTADVKLIRTDNQGNLIWQKTFGQEGKRESVGGMISVDLGYYVTGSSDDSDSLYVSFFNRQGEELWMRKYADKAENFGIDIIETSPGKIVVAGMTRFLKDTVKYYFDSDVWLMGLSEAGSLLWQKFFRNGLSDGARSLFKTFDNGFIMSGFFGTDQNEVSGDLWLVRMDEKGEILWSQTYEGYYTGKVIETKSREFTMISLGASEYLLLHLNSFGEIQWEKKYAGKLYDVKELDDGGYIILGENNTYDWLGNGKTDIWLIRTDENGESIWTKSIGGVANDTGAEIKQAADGGFIIIGSTESYDASEKSEIFLVKVTPENPATGILDKTMPEPHNFKLRQNYPNPFNPETMINYQLPLTSDVELSIYNVLGQKIATLVNKRQQSGNHSVIWDGTIGSGIRVGSGIYYYSIKAGSFNAVKRMVLIK